MWVRICMYVGIDKAEYSYKSVSEGTDASVCLYMHMPDNLAKKPGAAVSITASHQTGLDSKSFL